MGVVPDKDYKVMYSGKHDNSIMGVANKDYDAAPVASSVLDRMHDKGIVNKALDAMETAGTLPGGLDRANVTVEPPRDPAHGDLATNAAMVLAKPAKTNPRALAEALAAELSKEADIAALPERLVFNCTGLGARDLFGDTELQPMRGQLAVLMPQPEIDYAYETAGGAYMFSRSDGILLGGTADPGDWSTRWTRFRNRSSKSIS